MTGVRLRRHRPSENNRILGGGPLFLGCSRFLDAPLWRGPGRSPGRPGRLGRPGRPQALHALDALDTLDALALDALDGNKSCLAIR